MVKKFLIFVIFIFIVGCNQLRPVKIGEIVEHPRKYEGKTVVVKGEVTDVFSLVKIKFFELKDETGSIDILTKRALPNIGDTVSVRGVVKPFSLGSKQIIIIEEK